MDEYNRWLPKLTPIQEEYFKNDTLQRVDKQDIPVELFKVTRKKQQTLNILPSSTKKDGCASNLGRDVLGDLQ